MTVGDLRQISGKLLDLYLAIVFFGARFFVKSWWDRIAAESAVIVAKKKLRDAKADVSRISSASKVNLIISGLEA